jgi:hypothetical protein
MLPIILCDIDEYGYSHSVQTFQTIKEAEAYESYLLNELENASNVRASILNNTLENLRDQLAECQAD